MSSLDIAYANTKKNEGGYVNNPNDAGGETYAGISRVYHPNWSGWAFIDAKKKVAPIKWNTKFPELDSSVAAFYKTNYWDNKSFGNIASQSIANVVHDTYVTSGSYLGWIMKKALTPSYAGAISKSVPFNSDTINQVNNFADQKALFDNFQKARGAYFTAIGKGSNATFLPGWLTRLNTFAFTDVTSVVKKNYKWIALGAGLILIVFFIVYYERKTLGLNKLTINN